jgi:DNA-binding transcriptional regulator YdaS (Cro superfamily)
MDDDEHLWDLWEQELVWLIGWAGGVNKLGGVLGINPSAISRWLRRQRKPSPQQALAIEALTEGRIKREIIRPDIYPPAVLMTGTTTMEGFEKKPFRTLDKGPV